MSNEMPAVIRAFQLVNQDGVISAPRGKKIKEILFARIAIDYPFHSLSFRPRDNLDYIKKEFMWYLRGDPFDDSICQEASIWETIKQPDGCIFSNYGYYWFRRPNKDGRSGFEYVCETLLRDPDSRQAYIPMLGNEHIFNGNKDVVCTKGISFRIVKEPVEGQTDKIAEKLIMHVNMRSSDLAIGSSIDWPTFWWLHEMVSLRLRVPKGVFIFDTDSLHVYEKDWPYMYAVAGCNGQGFSRIEYPPIDDIDDLLMGTLQSDFGKWLRGK